MKGFNVLCNNRTLIVVIVFLNVAALFFYNYRNFLYFRNFYRPQLVSFVKEPVHVEVKWPNIKDYWFFPGGTIYPKPAKRDPKTNRRLATVYPEESASDRIIDQLMFVPANYDPKTAPVKIISVPKVTDWWDYIPVGTEAFKNCPVNACVISSELNEKKISAAIFKKSQSDHRSMFLSHRRTPDQIWMFFSLESAYHTPSITADLHFNWTATYREDGDVPTPYNRWIYYDPNVKSIDQNGTNFAANKKKKVAWLVSNCHPQNKRMEFALSLQRYIEVDIFGKCGDPFVCQMHGNCLDYIATHYKFYLAFENSNCKSYVTEKLFSNSLNNSILPIVMGAPRIDYEHYAPEKSFIHVEDFETPKDLAQYLHTLDKNDSLYNEFFQWKNTGRMFQNLNLFFGCRLCAMLHDDYRITKTYTNFPEWWGGNGVCRRNFWKEPKGT